MLLDKLVIIYYTISGKLLIILKNIKMKKENIVLILAIVTWCLATLSFILGLTYSAEFLFVKRLSVFTYIGIGFFFLVIDILLVRKLRKMKS